jgi:hypothetical protein
MGLAWRHEQLLNACRDVRRGDASFYRCLIVSPAQQTVEPIWRQFSANFAVPGKRRFSTVAIC